MTTATVGTLLNSTTGVLADLMRKYDSLACALRASDPAMADFALFLGVREGHTIAAIEGYRERDEDHAALDVYVRLGSGFPFSADDLQLPEHATLDELLELGERTDTLIEHLCERIKIYAVSGDLTELLDALEELVGERRRALAAALHELEKYRPSPKQVHK